MSPDFTLGVCALPARGAASRAVRGVADHAGGTSGPVPAEGTQSATPFGDLLTRLAGRPMAVRHGQEDASTRPSTKGVPGDEGGAPCDARAVVPAGALPPPVAVTPGACCTAATAPALARGDEPVGGTAPREPEDDGGGGALAPAASLARCQAAAQAQPGPVPASSGPGVSDGPALPDGEAPQDDGEALPVRSLTPAAPRVPGPAADVDPESPAGQALEALRQVPPPTVTTSTAPPVNDGPAPSAGPSAPALVSRIAADLYRLFAAEPDARTNRGSPAPSSGQAVSTPSAAETVAAATSGDDGGHVRFAGAWASTGREPTSFPKTEAVLLRSLGPAARTAAWEIAAAAPGPSAAAHETTGAKGAPSPTSWLVGADEAPVLWATPNAAISASRTTLPAGSSDGTGRTAAQADAQSVVPQIVKAIHLQWKQGLGEARIRLEPEHLGEVQVTLRVQAGGVTALVKAENPTVQGWIEVRRQELESALGQQGLRLQRFEVVVDPEGRRQGREAPPESPARRSRQAGADAEFVVED